MISPGQVKELRELYNNNCELPRKNLACLINKTREQMFEKIA